MYNGVSTQGERLLKGGDYVKELSRKERVLKMIVEEFVRTAEPIGSQALIAQYKLEYSSATIRNEMAELENQGYLEKMHTSSGRVPSAEGYRYYVDYLREKKIDDATKHQLQTLFAGKSININEVIKHGCEIISQMTQLTSIVLGPNAQFERINRIQLMPLNENSVVAIFITDRDHIEHKIFNVPSEVALSELETCVNVLNDRIVGTPLNKVVEKVNSLRPILAEKVKHSEVLFQLFLEAFLKFTAERVDIYGRNHILEQPEFTNDIARLRKFVNLLEKDFLWGTIKNDEDILVRIGKENIVSELDDFSVITANLRVSPGHKETIALIGPTRMDYDKAVNALEFLQKEMEKLFFNPEEEEEEEEEI